MGHTTSGIRNIALVGAAGAGKTLLAESLLLEAGAIRAKGSLARGNTVSDFDPQERELQHSLEPAVLTFDCDSARIHLLDTPGYPDLFGRTLSVLEAVEAVVVVVSAACGYDTTTRRLMDFARDRGLCRLVVINKIDSRDARAADVLAQLRETFGNECLPLNLPAHDGQEVVDCFFQPHGAPADFSSVETAHTQLVDQVIELDEKLMAVYLEQGEEISPEQLHDPFEQALREGHLVPVCFASAETGAGVRDLLRVFTRLMPNPGEGNPPPFLKGPGERAQQVTVSPEPSRHVVAHVFKVTIDPYVGKLGVLRVHQGTVRPGAQLFVGDARKPFKVAHLYRLLGKDTGEIPEAVPGDICAIAKVEELHLDAVLHDSHDEDQYHLKPVAFPPPMLGLAIRAGAPRRRAAPRRHASQAHRRGSVYPHRASRGGQRDGPLRHGGVASADAVGANEPALRRAREDAPAEHSLPGDRHTPGGGPLPPQEADRRRRPVRRSVICASRRSQRGAGFEFVDDVVGGAIPGQFIPAVEKGVRQVLTEGALAGYPLQDIRVTVYDGKHHAVDSKEVAFVSAGRKAFLDAIRKASPIVLEPIVHLEITAPASAIGDITGDLATKRARINGNNTLPGQLATVSALVPLAEISEYQTRLKALTGGQGTYSMELSHYDPVPPRRQQELVQAYRPRAEEE